MATFGATMAVVPGSDVETTRVDRWLWAVRITKTRSLATTACQGGHVDVNGTAAKPATKVKPGDRVEVRLDGRQRILEVVRPIEKRVSAPLAAEALVDHSPPPPERTATDDQWARDRGAGRPTKRERREIDRFRGR